MHPSVFLSVDRYTSINKKKPGNILIRPGVIQEDAIYCRVQTEKYVLLYRIVYELQKLVWEGVGSWWSWAMRLWIVSIRSFFRSTSPASHVTLELTVTFQMKVYLHVICFKLHSSWKPYLNPGYYCILFVSHGQGTLRWSTCNHIEEFYSKIADELFWRTGELSVG